MRSSHRGNVLNRNDHISKAHILCQSAADTAATHTLICRRLPGPQPSSTSTPQHAELRPAQRCLHRAARAPGLCRGTRRAGGVPASGPAAGGQEGVLQVFSRMGAVWGE